MQSKSTSQATSYKRRATNSKTPATSSQLPAAKTHLILIGFKNVGKSTIGRVLAQKLKRPFVDLDEKIIAAHESESGEVLSCRELMNHYGEEYFRKLEHQVLKAVLQKSEPLVLALGGGTPMLEANRQLLKPHSMVHISAPKSIVFERIIINGKPAFFPKDQEPFAFFQELWQEREPVFQKIANITVQNSGSIDDAVQEILQDLRTKFT